MTLYRVDSEGVAVEDVSMIFSSAEEAEETYGDGTVVVNAYPKVKIGWRWDGQKWTVPVEPGMQYDTETDTLYPHDQYREILHSRTTNDTMQAYRKLRQGDKTIDWQAWLDELDAYNVAIEETQTQPDYPNKVEYPEYPTKPTA